jgi:hypothetical protein
MKEIDGVGRKYLEKKYSLIILDRIRIVIEILIKFLKDSFIIYKKSLLKIIYQLIRYSLTLIDKEIEL